MTFAIKGMEELQKDLSKLSKQLPYAMSLTLNDLAFDAQQSLTKEIKHGMNVRDNTSKAFLVGKSNKTNLIATVRMKDDWHRTALQHHYFGGKGATIAFEKAMVGRGYMSAGNSAIPIKKMGKARYKTVLSATRRGARSKMFVVSTNNKNRRTKHLHPGVYTRLKRKSKPVILFTSEAKYQKRFDMGVTVEKVVQRRAEKYFWKNLDKAMGSAR